MSGALALPEGPTGGGHSAARLELLVFCVLPPLVVLVLPVAAAGVGAMPPGVGACVSGRGNWGTGSLSSNNPRPLTPGAP